MSTSYYEIHGVECMDIINALHASFRIGSIIKYIYRAGFKSDDPIEKDMGKALDYVDSIDEDDLTASAADVINAAYLVSKLEDISDFRRRALILACMLAYHDTYTEAQFDLHEHLDIIV